MAGGSVCENYWYSSSLHALIEIVVGGYVLHVMSISVLRTMAPLQEMIDHFTDACRSMHDTSKIISPSQFNSSSQASDLLIIRSLTWTDWCCCWLGEFFFKVIDQFSVLRPWLILKRENPSFSSSCQALLLYATIHPFNCNIECVKCYLQ